MNTFDHNMALSPELCELIGAYVGDGHLSKHTHGRTYILQFTGHLDLDYKYYKNTINPIIKKLFNKNLHLTNVRNKNYFRVNCYSKEIGLFLKNRFDLTLGNKIHVVKIPNEIMNSNKDFIYSTIKGIFDTDGCIFFDKRKIYKKPYPRITLNTCSDNLRKQLEEILSKDFKMYFSKDKRNNSNFVEIYGHKQIEKWIKLIGFSNERHFKKYASLA